MIRTEITIGIDKNVVLNGDLNIPDRAKALVIFSHGSGSSRFSKRNRYVAQILNKAGIATLLTDLLTEEEDMAYQNRFNIDLLSARLVTITNYCKQLPEIMKLPTGYFGASTGAASALKAAAILPYVVKAIVSRGGRPDLASQALPEIKAPTLLVVGELDNEVINLNKIAYAKLNCKKEFQIVKGAAHLFEEPGKLDEVGLLAAKWFNENMLVN